MINRSRVFGIGAAAAAVALALSSCSSASPGSDASTAQASGSSADTMTVAASFYPIQFLAERIGGDLVSVYSVTPQNVDPHSFELSPRDVTDLDNADLVVYVPGFQPSLDSAVDQVSGPQVLNLANSVDLRPVGMHEEECEHTADDGHDHGTLDPHFWLDIDRMSDAAESIEETLAAIDPANASTYEANRETLETELDALDDEYSQGLAQCTHRTFVTAHAAFGYLAEEYDLVEASVTGVNPDTEPSPNELAAITQTVRDAGISVIFTEELISPDIANTIAAETGATVEVLSPIASAPAEGDYISSMRNNLSQLQAALGCN